jgi:hypothetical protein
VANTRYDAPTGAVVDAGAQLRRVSDTLSAIAPAAAFSPRRDPVIMLSTGTTLVEPRAAGTTALLPTAGTGQRVTLVVAGALGACVVRPLSASYTINGAASFTLAAGHTSLIELVADGRGNWATTRASGGATTADFAFVRTLAWFGV